MAPDFFSDWNLRKSALILKKIFKCYYESTQLFFFPSVIIHRKPYEVCDPKKTEEITLSTSWNFLRERRICNRANHHWLFTSRERLEEHKNYSSCPTSTLFPAAHRTQLLYIEETGIRKPTLIKFFPAILDFRGFVCMIFVRVKTSIEHRCGKWAEHVIKQRDM